MKLALFKKKAHCRDCEFLKDLKVPIEEVNVCKVLNEFTSTSNVYWRNVENYDGRCRYYKERTVKEKGHAF